MKTIGFLLTYMFAFSALNAQNKQVTQITCSGFCWGMNYSEDGLMTGIVDNTENGGELLWSYDYHASIDDLPYILQNGYYRPGNEFYDAEGEPTFIRESKLNSDGLISNDYNRNTFMWSTGEDFEYEYNDGRMVKMTGDRGIVIELSWTEGNLTQIEFLKNNEEVGTVSCLYSTLPSKGVCGAFNSPLMLLLDYYNILSLGPLAYGYYGSLNQNLLKEITISFTENFIEEHSGDALSSGYYPITKKTSREYSYMKDAENNITSITVSEGNNETVYNLKYENSSTGVNPISFPRDDQNCCIDLQGRKLTSQPTQPGIYIQNGKKIVMK